MYFAKRSQFTAEGLLVKYACRDLKVFCFVHIYSNKIHFFFRKSAYIYSAVPSQKFKIYYILKQMSQIACGLAYKQVSYTTVNKIVFSECLSSKN